MAHNSKILIVEDEMMIAKHIENTLGNLGYKVVGIVSSGEDAIKKAGSEKPDLILMDIELYGDIDGIEASKEIIKKYQIPIIYLTAYSDSKTFRRAIATEPVNYLVKPFDEKELESVIETALFQNEINDE